MTVWWNTLDLLQQIFYLVAIPSTLILLLQTILLLFGMAQNGGADDVDMDTDGADFDYDADGMDLDHGHDSGAVGDHVFESDTDHDVGADHTGGLRLLTLRGIIAFLAIGGWAGLASLEGGASSFVSSLIALGMGLLALFAVALFLRFSMRLQENGNLDLRNAIGETGEVYLPIAVGGRGKVTLMLQERLSELDATTRGSESLKTGQAVQVVDVVGNMLLVVEPLGKSQSEDTLPHKRIHFQ